MPSPALMMWASTHWLTCWAAPLALCRMTSASTPIAATVSAVSRRDSPLEVEEPLPEMLMTSAESHLPAISNELRVRVESSKNRLTTVRPRRVGSFLTSRRCTVCISAAVSRISRICAVDRSLADSRCRRVCRPVAGACRVAVIGAPLR